MSFKNLVSSIKRAGSFFHLTSIDYPTLVDGVTDLQETLERSNAREMALLKRVEALEQSAHQAVDARAPQPGDVVITRQQQAPATGAVRIGGENVSG